MTRNCAVAVQVTVEKDLVYAENGRALRWDVYRAQAADRAPAVLVLHGGSWRAGDRSHVTDACEAFARHGYVAIAIEYRLIGEAAWPAPLVDVRTAVRAARAQAEALRIDPGALFLAGFSAGAHLALLAASGAYGAAQSGDPYAAEPECIAGVAAFFAQTRLLPSDWPKLGIDEASEIERASPLTHASALPPVILFCGDEDAITPHTLSIELYAAIRQAGGMSDLRLFGGLIHGFVRIPGLMDSTVGDAVEFFDRTVLSRRAFQEELDKLRQWWTELQRQHPLDRARGPDTA